MANAAAKRSSAARSAAKSTYLPIVLGWNIFYIVARVIYQWSSWSYLNMLASLLLWVLTYVSYVGILDQHENAALFSHKNDTKLEGGAWLDLLGLVIFIQFGTTLISSKFNWLLLVLPIWGAYKLYQLYGQGKNMMNNTENDGGEKEVADEATKEKRKKRAEKRRQKWS